MSRHQDLSPKEFVPWRGPMMFLAANTRDVAGEMAEQVKAVAAKPYPELKPQVLHGVR